MNHNRGTRHCTVGLSIAVNLGAARNHWTSFAYAEVEVPGASENDLAIQMIDIDVGAGNFSHLGVLKTECEN